MALPPVISPDESDEYYFKEGCHILEVLNSTDDQALSIARARVAPATATQLHALKETFERYYVLRGTGVVTVGCTEHPVGVGDVVCIAPGVAQKIKNTGNKDLVFLAMCTPRFILENYTEL